MAGQKTDWKRARPRRLVTNKKWSILRFPRRLRYENRHSRKLMKLKRNLECKMSRSSWSAERTVYVAAKFKTAILRRSFRGLRWGDAQDDCDEETRGTALKAYMAKKDDGNFEQKSKNRRKSHFTASIWIFVQIQVSGKCFLTRVASALFASSLTGVASTTSWAKFSMNPAPAGEKKTFAENV